MDKLILKSMAESLPAAAQKEDYDGSSKSYVIRQADHKSTICVRVDVEMFYVCPVDELPSDLEDSFNINKQEPFFNTHTCGWSLPDHMLAVVGRCLTLSQSTVCGGRALPDQRFAWSGFA